MIQINDLTFAYPGSKTNVFENLSLNLEGNSIYGLLGKNGTGKSTLLYNICGLLLAKKGTVTIDGMNVKERLPEVTRDIFLVSEEFTLPQMKLSEYVKINSVFYPNFSKETLDFCLKEFGLEGDIKLNSLSMGQKKKVYMSFALATNTRYLIMDEPTNGLDIPSKAQFRKVIAQNMSEDRTIIISTHQVHDVNTLLDHVVILDHSDVLLNASVGDICDKYVFEIRTPNDMADAIYAEPSLQGNAVMAPRGDKPETPLNLELLFNAFTLKKV